MKDIIILLILVAIIAAIIVYLVKVKKRGGCVGCPHSKQCKNGGACNCSKN